MRRTLNEFGIPIAATMPFNAPQLHVDDAMQHIVSCKAWSLLDMRRGNAFVTLLHSDR